MSGLREEVGKVRNCECDEWREGVTGLFQYAGVPGRKRFKYCPWCGKELEEKKEEAKEVRTCRCKELMGTGQIDVLYCPVCKGEA